MKSWFVLTAAALAASLAFAQAPQSAPAKKAPATSVKKAPAKAAAAKPAPLPPAEPKEDGLYANIRTSMGDMTVKLFEAESPITVKNFVDLALGRKAWTHPKTGLRAAKPLYNGLTFHRVIPGFMIQGGDPTGTGMGGTEPIKDEFHPTLKFDIPGRLAMANAGPGTGSCQFFITEVPTPHLNGRHTIFGQVIKNQDLVAKITGVPRGARDLPNTPVRIVKVDFERWAAGKPAPVVPPAKPAAKKAAAPAKGTVKSPATAKKTAAPVKK